MKTLVVMFAAFISGHSYPMRVKIVSVSTQTQFGSAFEHGYGDIAFATGRAIGGFEFTSDCTPFSASHGQEFYWGRLEDDQSRLVLAVQEIGSDKARECKLKLTLRPWLYVADASGNITTRPTVQMKSPGN